MLKKLLSAFAAVTLSASALTMGVAPAQAEISRYTGDCEVFETSAYCNGPDFGDLNQRTKVTELFYKAGNNFDFRLLSSLKNLTFIDVVVPSQQSIINRVGEEFSSPEYTAFDGSPIYFDYSSSSSSIVKIAEGRFKTLEPLNTIFSGYKTGSYINGSGLTRWVLESSGSTELVSAVDLNWGSTSKTQIHHYGYKVSEKDAAVPDETSLAITGNLPEEDWAKIDTECIWYRDGKKIFVPRTNIEGGCAYIFSPADSGKEIKLVAKHSPRNSNHPELIPSQDTKTFKFLVDRVFKISSSVSGSQAVDSVLSAKTSKLPAGSKLAYQWLRNGQAIKNAKKSTYRLTAADQGQKISVAVTASKSGYFTKKITSAKTAAIKKGTFKVTKAPKIKGKAVFGQTLKVDAGTRTAKPSKYTYQWLRDGKTIKGATKPSYKLVKADLGKKVSVKVTAARAGFTSQTSTTAKTKSVAKAAFKLKKSPTVTGKVKVGKKLTAKPGSWSPKPDKYSYQWYRSGAAIKKATKSTYKLTKRDRGAVIYVKVTAKKAGYKDKSAQSKVK